MIYISLISICDGDINCNTYRCADEIARDLTKLKYILDPKTPTGENRLAFDFFKSLIKLGPSKIEVPIGEQHIVIIQTWGN
jgi:hypothetical protein